MVLWKEGNEENTWTHIRNFERLHQNFWVWTCLDKQSFRTLLVIDRNRNFNLSSNDVKFYLIDSYYNQVHLKLLPFWNGLIGVFVWISKETSVPKNGLDFLCSYGLNNMWMFCDCGRDFGNRCDETAKKMKKRARCEGT